MTKSAATPRPWTIVHGVPTLINAGHARPMRSVATTHVYEGKSTLEDEANAELIVACVNAELKVKELCHMILEGEATRALRQVESPIVQWAREVLDLLYNVTSSRST